MARRLHEFWAEVRRTFVPLWDWWLRELREITAALMLRLAPRLITRTLIILGPDGGSIWALRGAARECLESFTGEPDQDSTWWLRLATETVTRVTGTRAEIALTPESVLTRSLIMPATVKADLDQVVSLQLERECPLPLDQVYVDKRIVDRWKAEQRIAVEIRMVQRSRIERLREVTRNWNVQITRIGVNDKDGSPVGNFLRTPTRLAALRLSALDRRLIASAITLATVFLGLIGFHWGSERVQLGRELQRLKAPANAAATLARQLQSTAAPAEALVGLMRQSDALDAVAALNDAVPKDSWVYDLDVVAQFPQAPRVKFSGFAPTATMLVGVLESSHRFGRVRLVSAQSAGLGSGQDRLQVSAQFLSHGDKTPATSAAEPNDSH